MQKDPIIIFSTADWDNPFWTNKQHTAQKLADRGHPVLYIESLGLRAPTIKAQDLNRIIKRILSFFKGARKVQPNLWVYSPLVIPFHRYKAIRIFNDLMLILILRFFKMKLNLQKPIVWTYNPLVLNLIKSLNPKKIVYHSVDDLSAAPGMDKELILKNENKLLHASDAVFCTSLTIYDHCKKIAGKRAHYFSNVVDYEHFSQAKKDIPEPEDLKDIPHPRLGFIGAISEYKVDFELINTVAKEKPEWHWVLIGKVGEGQPLSKLGIEESDNIHLLGPRDYKNLPEYLKYFDVCTIPCPINDYTQSMFPMKFYEYMAAGKPIIAKDINSLSALNDVFYSFSSNDQFVELTNEAITHGVKNKKKCIQLSKLNTWSIRLNKMMSFL